MRYFLSLLVLASICVVPQANAAERFSSPLELSLVGGFSDGPGYAGRAPRGAFALNGGTHMFRLHVTASGSLMHKTETPGGYWVGFNGGAELRVHGFSVVGGMTSSHTDQTIWTKDVRYVYGGLGYRWDFKPNERGVPRTMHFAGFTYYQESYSTYANHTHVYDISYKYYHRLGKRPLYVHVVVVMGAMAYNDGPHPGAERHTGLSSDFNIGLAWLPR